MMICPMSEAQTCFVIAPIGDPDTDVRKRSDQILKHVFKPAAEACGYKATRADEISEPGIIVGAAPNCWMTLPLSPLIRILAPFKSATEAIRLLPEKT